MEKKAWSYSDKKLSYLYVALIAIRSILINYTTMVLHVYS